MTTKLSSPIPAEYVKAENREVIFSEKERKDKLEKLWEPREQPKLCIPGKSCETELFFGFFFDGTRNNYELADKNGTRNHSNVARLYDCFPGQSVPGVLPSTTDWEYNPGRYTHFFRTYIPGVGSPFKEVGEKTPHFGGAGAGGGGGARIVWALLQAINNVHRYFHKLPLISNDEALKLAQQVAINNKGLAQLKPGSAWVEYFKKKDDATQLALEKILQRLHTAVTPHWFDKMRGRPPKIDPGIVTQINVSVFGFSRGAAQARAFTSWLVALCQRDARLHGRGSAPMTLGGFPVTFTFLGLFDTVASVGAANTMGNQFGLGAFDGHGAWADADYSLRIPAGVPTVHLVAAHEVRRSFPLDSVSVGNNLPDDCQEWVYPGMHSDVGGAYSPTEQGKGTSATGSDMMARIPLITMYREARLRGVPLKLELAKPIVKERFALELSTIKAFNDYLRVCKTQTGTLTQIMREQRRLLIQWHVLRRASGAQPLEKTASFLRASTFDQNDLHSANLEFETEIAEFERWLGAKGAAFAPRTQPVGFDDEHLSEWEEIATWWRSASTLVPEMVNLFDEYVHDSRAWFKLVPTFAGGSPDNEEEVHGMLAEWVKKRKAAQLQSIRNPGSSDGLTPEQRTAADSYAKTGKIPTMVNAGREPYAGAKAGYLRYRKVYAGGDSMLLSGTGLQPVHVAQKQSVGEVG
jgi:Uncharacterized alpha/beta hydrolase domain (DUF2235)